MNYELLIAKRIIFGKDKYRTSFTIIKIATIAIVLGVVMMMLSVATGTGLQNKIREKISGFKGDILVTNFDNNHSEITLIPIEKRQDFYPKFEEIEGIKNVQVFASKYGIIRTEKDFEGVLLKGVDENYDWQFFEKYLTEGRLPNISEKRTDEVLISNIIANKLNFKLGEKINIFFLKDKIQKLPNRRIFKIIGIYNSGYKEFDEKYIIGDIKHIQKLNKWNKNEVGGFEIFIDNFSEIDKKGKDVYYKIASTLKAETIKELYPIIFEWMGLFDINIYIIIVIMILVSGINMITALLVLILERTQMIGVLKVLGATNYSIRKIFLYNATYIIIRGLFYGNIIGLTILFVQKEFGIITLNPENYYVDKVSVYINFTHIFLLNIGTLFLCFSMLLLPSLMITKINPSKVIKF